MNQGELVGSRSGRCCALDQYRINIGVAAPMAYFSFTGWKDSFFGDLHGQGRVSVEFYKDKKVVVERWGNERSRKF